LVIYQESLHDARTTKYKTMRFWFFALPKKHFAAEFGLWHSLFLKIIHLAAICDLRSHFYAEYVGSIFIWKLRTH